MTGPVVSRSPTCLSCMRRLAQPFLSLPLVQARAKSTHLVPSDKGVIVRLLANIPKFGRKDAIFRVERGRMRNEWYPRRLAEYMTVARFKQLGLSPKTDVGERDPTFVDMKALEQQLPALEPSAPVVKPQQDAKPVKKVLKPERVRELLSRLIPKTTTFYRIPIPAPPSNTTTISPLIAVAAAQETQEGPVAIYGSVSTKDIASSIKSRISADEDGAQIVVEPTHIRVLGLKDTSNKIKELGRFEVKVSIGNSDLEPITVFVEVLPGEEKAQGEEQASLKTAA
ncbi:hypothetical protein QBC41DRAFT_312728 [Cercophora samala]|uniref:Ribosomal protein L9 domain-containing protein n=1 Tax=Cercophora samala TaxID=330535 RepID=A0AA39ZKL6_9PEZI|nr:hypothetical protein QBC41DRAFT_312728 [Cercophora samala]